MGFAVDLVGTQNVFEGARLYGQHQSTHGKPIKLPLRVIFPSTIASFGEHIPPQEKTNVPNEAQQFPTTVYGTAKVAAERIGEYYHRKGWIDFRAVRFPSIIGALRGPGGTTVYSTLMIQQVAHPSPKPYEVYVNTDTRLAIIYVKDAVEALLQLHDCDEANRGQLGRSSVDASQRRVFNLRGITISGDGNLPPTALDIANEVKTQTKRDLISFQTDDVMQKTVNNFLYGILISRSL